MLKNKEMRSNLSSEDLLKVFKTGLEHTDKSVLIVDFLSDKIVANNLSAETLFGYARGEMLGMHVSKLDAESSASIREAMSICHEEGECWDGEIKNFRKDGTPILTGTRTVSLGEYYISFQEEITHRKYTEFFASIFFTDANTGFAILDEDLNVVEVNETGLSVFSDESKSDVVGKNILELDSSIKKRATYKAYRHVLKTGIPHEINALELNGHWFKVKAFRIHRVGVGVVCFDITEQIQAVLQAEAAQKKSEELNQFKDGIIRNVTHEFRIPLNSFSGFLDILSHSEDKETFELVECMKSSAERLNDISNKFIDSHVIRNKTLVVNAKSIDVKKVVSEIFTLLGKIASEKQIDFILDIDIDAQIITTDRDFFSLIIINLMSNAIKFSFPKSTVKVHISKMSDITCIKIIDTGIGIDPKNHHRIFESFYQVDFSACRRYDGIGLGLYNSWNYTRLLGGEIEVESELGEGATFTLKVPDLPISST